jgi:chitodextrinase
LVYSIHVSSGFTAIETILNDNIQGDTAVWFYGNVYDPASGEPLNWWQSILAPE